MTDQQIVLDFPDLPTPGEGPPAKFDRFYFNLTGPREQELFFVLGGGIYEPAGVVDAYLCVAVDGKQRNLRVSEPLRARPGTRVGPLRWSVPEEMSRWRLELGPNPSGIEFELEWRARSDAFVIPEYRAVDDEGTSSYTHYFQSGRYAGELRVDGRRIDVGGWYGQRDRSRGERRTRDRLGFHTWVQVQRDGDSIGLLYNEDRQGQPSHCAGAVMRDGGGQEQITDVFHDLSFDDLELRGGTLWLRLESGELLEVEATNRGRGIYMTGGGYAGFHGTPQGDHCVQSESWELDGSRNPRNLALSMTDALCDFTAADAYIGSGIFEYGLSRSESFTYRPRLPEQSR
jgi:hypothetical protein